MDNRAEERKRMETTDVSRNSSLGNQRNGRNAPTHPKSPNQRNARFARYALSKARNGETDFQHEIESNR